MKNAKRGRKSDATKQNDLDNNSSFLIDANELRFISIVHFKANDTRMSIVKFKQLDNERTTTTAGRQNEM